MSTFPAPADLRAMAWRSRRGVVAPLMTSIAQDGLDAGRETLLEVLVDDPKWEVRKEVAEHLLDLGDDHIVRFAARLGSDTNHHVVSAAKRALDRHRKGVQEQFRRRRGILEVQDQFQAIERLHGRVAADKARQMAERLYDVTVGATVHEMRGLITPLVDWVAGMRSQAEVGTVDLAYARRYLPRMHDRLMTLQAVLEDMREFSRTTPPGRTTEAVHLLVGEALLLCQDWFTATGVDISMVAVTVEVPPTILVEVSRHQLVVALRNVIKNAIESLAISPTTLVPGTVVIHARLDSDQVVIQVTDTGMGLEPEELEEVRKFVPGKTSKKALGTGFGLPTAWRKLHDHGGDLTIDSRPNAGTTVIMMLPVQAGVAEDS
jgi:signal transduction histidine kinase